MSTALAERSESALTAADQLWNAEQQRAIREMLIPADRDGRRPAVSDAQMALFGEVCQRTGLDPFLRQCYLIPTGRGQVDQDEVGVVPLGNIAALRRIERR